MLKCGFNIIPDYLKQKKMSSHLRGWKGDLLDVNSELYGKKSTGSLNFSCSINKLIIKPKSNYNVLILSKRVYTLNPHIHTHMYHINTHTNTIVVIK